MTRCVGRRADRWRRLKDTVDVIAGRGFAPHRDGPVALQYRVILKYVVQQRPGGAVAAVVSAIAAANTAMIAGISRQPMLISASPP